MDLAIEKTIYVVVHSGIINSCAEISPLAKQRKERIEEIMAKEEYYEVLGNPNLLPERIPPPQKGQKVMVCGAMTTNCVEKQWFALRQSDYQAWIDYDASYDQNSDPYWPNRT